MAKKVSKEARTALRKMRHSIHVAMGKKTMTPKQKHALLSQAAQCEQDSMELARKAQALRRLAAKTLERKK